MMVGMIICIQLTNNKRVLWELLEETFLRRTVDVKVQSLSGHEQGRNGEEGEEGRMHLDLLLCLVVCLRLNQVQ